MPLITAVVLPVPGYLTPLCDYFAILLDLFKTKNPRAWFWEKPYMML